MIRQITSRFVSRLPGENDFYRIEDLETYGFPVFLIRRIHLELQWNLDESMMLPKTDWANTESEAVQKSWHQFLKAIHAEVKLPASYAKAVIETAVADIVEMLIQPRKNITDILFGGQKKLSAAELTERTELLVVYSHFARVLNRYMEQKDKNELSREHCQKVIRQVDEKVTNQYTPLQWAQMLDPLFTLAGTTIDTNLFRLFFEDRNMRRIAQKFDMMDSEIRRSEFIEVLSSPKLLNYDGYEEDQSELFDEEQDEVEPREQAEDDEEAIPNPQEEEEQVETEFIDEKEKSGEPEEKTRSNVEWIEPDEEEETEEKQFEEQESAPEPEENEEIEPEPDFEIVNESKSVIKEELPSSLNDIFVGEETDEEEEPEATIDITEDTQEKSEEKGGSDNESPIWMRFMDSDESDADELEMEQARETSANTNMKEEKKGVSRVTKRDLESVLADDRRYFIENLFNGSEQAYKKSLRQIAQRGSWQEASVLIRQNIFEQYDINIYSEAAVDFTDRLHTYFIRR